MINIFNTKLIYFQGNGISFSITKRALLTMLFYLLLSQNLLHAREDSLLTRISSIKNPKQKLTAIVEAFKSIRNYDELAAVRILNEGIELAVDQQDMKSKAKLLLTLGLQYQNIGGFHKASEQYFESLKIFRELNDSKMQVTLLRRIGDNFRSAENQTESVKYLKQSLTLAENLADTVEMAKIYNRLAATLFESYASIGFVGLPDTTQNKYLKFDWRSHLYVYQALFDSLSAVVHKALRLSEKIRDVELKISTLNILGAFFNCVESKSDSAKWTLEEGIRLGEQINAVDDLVLLYNNLSGYYKFEKQNNKRLEVIKKSFYYAEKSENKILLRIAAESMAYTYRDLGRFKEQAHYIELAYSLNLYIYNTDTQRKLLLQRAEFEEQRNTATLLAAKRQNSIVIISLVVIILMFIAFITVLIHRNRFIHKANVELNKMNLLISEQRDELDAANMAKDKLFSIIAHDLKSPFTGLAGFSKILAEEYKTMPDEELGQSLYDLSKTSNTLYELTLNLLNWAELQLHQGKHTPAEFPIADLSEKILKTFYLNAMNKEINILADFDDKALVYADIDEIYSVMHNLVSNAIKFTPRGGCIYIETEQDENFVTVSVRDTGIGMPKDVQDNLFILGGGSSNFGTEGEKGTGLGLMICHEMMEKNNGKIWTKSEFGKGSTFFIALPLLKLN